METLTLNEQKKVDYVVSLLATQKRLPTKFIKHIKDGLYELRVMWQSNIYRVFFIFDEGNIVVLFSGFQKKTQKTPLRQIDQARRELKDLKERGLTDEQ